MPPTKKLRNTVTFPTRMPKTRRGVIALRDCRSGLEFPFTTSCNIVSIGGSKHCDITVEDPYASARHCTVERRSERWYVRDQGSKNGTLVDGLKVETAELTPGAQLLIGRTRLVALGPTSSPSTRALVGAAPCFLEALNLAKQAARGSCSILLLGETGTGKELFARLIHEESRLSRMPYVPVNCGAIPRDLVASELFGHVRGAFTGATTEHEGYFLQADGGTLFLDEIGELPMEQQPHLLRALETRMIRRVGATLEQMVNVRLVAATNRLDIANSSRRLRKDLYHRLATVVIELPALRERISDLPQLVAEFLKQHESEYGPHQVSDETIEQLQEHCWPGNIRELRNATERAAACSRGELRATDFLPGGVLRTPDAVDDPSDDDKRLAYLLRENYQRWGSIRKAAEAMGIPKSTFADQCARLGIATNLSRKKLR
jgi:DNA-binding NtrC family response regulator